MSELTIQHRDLPQEELHPPQSHAATHAPDGTDPLTPAGLGAAPATHTHPEYEGGGTPVLGMAGDQLTINGVVTGPHLTGPAGADGHTPALAWAGDRLSLDGVPGPPLTGPPGTPGADGQAACWYAAAGAPSAGLGVDGDQYLDTGTGDVYARQAGAWGQTGNIRGPAGNPGAVMRTCGLCIKQPEAGQSIPLWQAPMATSLSRLGAIAMGGTSVTFTLSGGGAVYPPSGTIVAPTIGDQWSVGAMAIPQNGWVSITIDSVNGAVEYVTFTLTWYEQ